MTGAPVKYVAKSLWKKIQKLSACNSDHLYDKQETICSL